MHWLRPSPVSSRIWLNGKTRLHRHANAWYCQIGWMDWWWSKATRLLVLLPLQIQLTGGNVRLSVSVTSHLHQSVFSLLHLVIKQSLTDRRWVHLFVESYILIHYNRYIFSPTFMYICNMLLYPQIEFWNWDKNKVTLASSRKKKRFQYVNFVLKSTAVVLSLNFFSCPAKRWLMTNIFLFD